MKYLFLLYNDEDGWDALSSAEKTEAIGAYVAYTETLKHAGAHLAGDPLDHSRNGKRVRGAAVEDGPFADGKEQLGGYYLVEASNLDEALDWAARCPCAATGHVEVRPVWEFNA